MTTNSLERRIDKLTGPSRYIEDGRGVTILDDGTPERAKLIEEAKSRAEAEGRDIIEMWIVGDDGQKEHRFSVAVTSTRRI